jgi:hypothetical protein
MRIGRRCVDGQDYARRCLGQVMTFVAVMKFISFLYPARLLIYAWSDRFTKRGGWSLWK